MFAGRAEPGLYWRNSSTSTFGPADRCPAFRAGLGHNGISSLNNKLTLSSSPVEEASLPSDDAIRQALLRMGSGARPQKQPPRQQPQHQQRSGVQTGPHAGDSRRRRFSENERVPVEYVGRDRGASRADPVEPAAFGAAPELDKLQRILELERRAREAAEQNASELKLQLQAMQTRLAHVTIELDEMRATRAAEAAATAVALSNAATTAAAAEKAPARPRIRTRHADFDDEQEPVTWWIRE